MCGPCANVLHTETRASSFFNESANVNVRGALREFPEWWSDPAKLRTSERVFFTAWHHYERDDPLLDAGLAGPVRLFAVKAIPREPCRPENPVNCVLPEALPAASRWHIMMGIESGFCASGVFVIDP